MSETCIFCQIITGKAPGEIVYRDEQVTVMHDHQPAAPVHLLIVPNRHISSLNQAGEADEALLGHVLLVARKLAEENGVSQSGYRVMINTGADAGQTEGHLHAHVMGGRRLTGLTR